MSEVSSVPSRFLVGLSLPLVLSRRGDCHLSMWVALGLSATLPLLCVIKATLWVTSLAFWHKLIVFRGHFLKCVYWRSHTKSRLWAMDVSALVKLWWAIFFIQLQKNNLPLSAASSRTDLWMPEIIIFIAVPHNFQDPNHGGCWNFPLQYSSHKYRDMQQIDRRVHFLVVAFPFPVGIHQFSLLHNVLFYGQPEFSRWLGNEHIHREVFLVRFTCVFTCYFFLLTAKGGTAGSLM